MDLKYFELCRNDCGHTKGSQERALKSGLHCDNKPFPHSTSERTNNSTRTRLGWTFSYIHCIFVHPDLDSAPLFAGSGKGVLAERTVVFILIPYHSVSFNVMARNKDTRPCSGQ